MAKKDVIKRVELIFLFVLLAFTAIFRAQVTDMPLDKNEGAYAYGAVRISQGAVPYRDFFEHRPPMILYLYRAAFSAFGQTDRAVRYFTTVCAAAAAILIYILARVAWRSAFIAMLASFFYVIYQNSFALGGLCADTAVFAQLPVLICLLLACDRDSKYESVNFCASGFFAGIAVLTDLMTVFLAAAVVLYAAVYGGKNRMKNIAWFFAGCISVPIASAAWAFFNGAQKQMFDGVFGYNWKAFAAALKGPRIPETTGYLALFIYADILPCAAFIYSAWVFFKRKKDGVNFLLFCAAVSLCTGILAAPGASTEYYLALMPLAALLSALLVRDIYALISSGTGPKKYAPVILGMFLVLNIAVISKANNAVSVISGGEYTKKIYYEERSMAREIAADSYGKPKKDNFVFAWPDMPAVYFMTGAKAASVYSYSYPLEILKNDKPKLIGALIDGRPSWAIMQKGTHQSYQAFLDNYYAKEAETKDLVLYRNILF